MEFSLQNKRKIRKGNKRKGDIKKILMMKMRTTIAIMIVTKKKEMKSDILIIIITIGNKKRKARIRTKTLDKIGEKNSRISHS